jgi:hypothetical protein
MKPQPNPDAKEPVNSEMEDYEHLLQYIAETKNTEYRRPLQEFRGIAPNLLEGQETQEWVSQMRDEWEERDLAWRKSE